MLKVSFFSAKQAKGVISKEFRGYTVQPNLSVGRIRV